MRKELITQAETHAQQEQRAIQSVHEHVDTVRKQLYESLGSSNANTELKLTQHSQFVEKEYIEFFKSRRRIKDEWAQFSQQVQDKIDQQLQLIADYEDHLARINLNDNIIA